MDIFDVTIRDYLRLLEKMARENTELMKQNNEQFNERNSETTTAREKTEFLNSLLTKNSRLSQENKKIRDIHAKLLEFMHDYGTQVPIESNSNSENKEEREFVFNGKAVQTKGLDKNDIFGKTIKGELALNQEHPFISDSEFLNRLLTHFTENEDYEKCAEIIKYRS